MPPAEPSIATLRNPALRYFLATRPPFLSVTLACALLGLAAAFWSGLTIDAVTATVTVVFALIAHAGVNVLNDYYDALNGTDAINTERVFPFTGGSRFIQNGVLSTKETAIFGLTLVLAVVVAGLWLMKVSSTGLVWIGLAGLIIGWAYSAPPLALNSRGFGELCVWAGFALIAIGADFVQRGTFSTVPLVAAAGYALLVTNILYINQFPDRKADEAAGKHHWVVRLGAEHAVYGYAAIGIAAYGAVVLSVVAHALPRAALVALAPAAMTLRAYRILAANANRPEALAPAIQATIGAACLHALLLAAALVVARVFA
jgi:1,4-dihydroxy-2-naphthoate polyprenyltransferase